MDARLAIARRLTGPRIGAAALSLILVGGCDPSTPSPSSVNAPSASPNAATSGPVAPVSSSAPASSAAGLVLSEVRFSPLAGDPPFIEIANTGSAPVALAGLSLTSNDRPLDLRSGEAAIGPGERLVVLLDGPRDPEGHVAHAAAIDLGSDAGNVQLLDGEHRLVDRVAWGSGQSGAVSMAIGDFAPAAIEPGTTIGRPPGVHDPLQPAAWVAYPPASATPGSPNLVPRVEVLLPMDGAILDDPAPSLEWYPVTGASSYQVQVATEDTFASPRVDATVTEPRIELGSLAPGRYVWRVQAMSADGSASSQSAPSGFELVGGVARIESVAYRVGPPSSGIHVAQTDVVKRLPVPFLPQHKDTTMLLLEEPHEQAPMAWDTAHNPPRREDPADQQNCALAMVAMVNHFYGGDLSQDRIGYEIFKGRKTGPEEDLNYGYGLTSGEPSTPTPGYVDQTMAAFAFALGAPVTVPSFDTFDDVWTIITTSIDAGRPVAGAGPHHGFVVTGYAVVNGHRIMYVNDPARGSYQLDLSAARGTPAQMSLWLMPGNPRGRRQEPSVTKDSDGDGVVDFDETERFGTSPTNPDSDGDKVRDKQDVASGVFEPTYGYAFHPGPTSRGRDFDGDGTPTERDPDSDHGGCRDGDEDKDVDGHRTGKETSNFDASDDVCGDLSGTITWTLHSSTDGPDSHATSDDQVTLNVRFDEQDGRWVDAGSSYAWTGSSRLDSNPGNDDPKNGYCNEVHKTTRTSGGESFAGSLASSINVEVDRTTKQVFVTSWVAGLLQGHNELGTPESNGGDTAYCVLKPSDYSQGGGSTQDSQAEWGQVPRCRDPEESVDGTISADGKTVAFSCTNTVTTDLQDGFTDVATMTVSGQLTFGAGAP